LSSVDCRNYTVLSELQCSFVEIVILLELAKVVGFVISSFFVYQSVMMALIFGR